MNKHNIKRPGSVHIEKITNRENFESKEVCFRFFYKQKARSF